MVFDDWPLKELEFKGMYKGLINTKDEATLRSYHASYTVARRRRPCIFLFNPFDFDSVNGMDWDWINRFCITVRLGDVKLFE